MSVSISIHHHRREKLTVSAHNHSDGAAWLMIQSGSDDVSIHVRSAAHLRQLAEDIDRAACALDASPEADTVELPTTDIVAVVAQQAPKLSGR